MRKKNEKQIKDKKEKKIQKNLQFKKQDTRMLCRIINE
jgi:hypothetical protein